MISVSGLSYTGKEPVKKPQASNAATIIGVGGLGYTGKEPVKTPQASSAGTVLKVSGLNYTGGKPQKQQKTKTLSAQLPVDEPSKGAAPTSLKTESRTGHRVADSFVLDIKLISAKTLSGADPFHTKGVRTMFAEKSSAPVAPSARNAALPEAPSSTPPSARSSAPPTLRVAAPPAGFTCSGKADGNYCKDPNTLVFCYHEGIANTQSCPGGCDEVTKACKAYKP